MRKSLSLGIFLLTFLSLGRSGADAQTTEIPPPAESPVTMAVYSRVPPGKRHDWLALYRKYHYPVMQRFFKDGIIKIINIYQRRFRAETPAWGYEVVLVWRGLERVPESHRQ